MSASFLEVGHDLAAEQVDGLLLTRSEGGAGYEVRDSHLEQLVYLFDALVGEVVESGGLDEE